MARSRKKIYTSTDHCGYAKTEASRISRRKISNVDYDISSGNSYKSSTKVGTFTIGDALSLPKLHGSLSRIILPTKTDHGSNLIVSGSGKGNSQNAPSTTPANRDASLSSQALLLIAGESPCTETYQKQ